MKSSHYQSINLELEISFLSHLETSNLGSDLCHFLPNRLRFPPSEHPAQGLPALFLKREWQEVISLSHPPNLL